MATATARAEARRKAILSRGTDRLSKLTSSARGEEGTTYINTQAPVADQPTVATFIGDDPPELPLPNPPPKRQSEPPSPVDPSVWSENQQAEFMRALGMGAAVGNPNFALPPSAASAFNQNTNGEPNIDFLNALMQQSGPPSPGGSSLFSSTSTATFPAVQKPKTLLQKLLPMVHILSVWLLFGFFVLWREPTLHSVSVPWQSDSPGGIWRRWAWLASETGGKEGVWSVQNLPFMWAFITLELILFSFRVLSGFDPIAPPTMLSFVLPMLPPQFSSLIMNGLRYLQMFGILLDDLAAALVAVGFMVVLSGWVAN